MGNLKSRIGSFLYLETSYVWLNVFNPGCGRYIPGFPKYNPCFNHFNSGFPKYNPRFFLYNPGLEKSFPSVSFLLNDYYYQNYFKF